MAICKPGFTHLRTPGRKEKWVPNFLCGNAGNHSHVLHGCERKIISPKICRKCLCLSLNKPINCDYAGAHNPFAAGNTPVCGLRFETGYIKDIRKLQYQKVSQLQYPISYFFGLHV